MEVKILATSFFFWNFDKIWIELFGCFWILMDSHSWYFITSKITRSLNIIFVDKKYDAIIRQNNNIVFFVN